MNPEYFDDYTFQHLDPLSPSQADFDWEAVYAALGDEPICAQDESYDRLVHAFRRVFEFCLTIDLNKENSTELIGRRLLALAWVMNPAIIDGSPSLIELSNRLGLSPYPLAIITSEVSKQFGIRNRAQAHAWNRGLKMKPRAHKRRHLQRPNQ
jgi:hypothetical protein